jgi:long-chain acyl-CoA synthetase
MHASTSGPIFATHAFDLQALPSAEGEQAHAGAPSVNVEVKLIGVDDATMERGNDPKGELLVRGPPVGTLLSGDANSTEREDQDWVQTGEIARVMTNGAFKVVGKKSH